VGGASFETGERGDIFKMGFIDTFSGKWLDDGPLKRGEFGGF